MAKAKTKVPKPEEILPGISYQTPAKGWMDLKPEFKPGTYCNPANPKWAEWIDYPYPRSWSVNDENWGLPANW